MRNNYYVYAYLNPEVEENFILEQTGTILTHKPFYVGKGKKNRDISHLKNLGDNSIKSNTINKILKSGKFPIIVRIADNLTEDDAYELEKLIIESIGTITDIKNIKRGPLTNMVPGGIRGGIPTSNPERKRDRSSMRKSQWQDPDMRPSLLKQAKDQMIKNNELILTDEEYRKNWLKSINESWTDERKEHHSNLTTEQWKDSESRKKLIESRNHDLISKNTSKSNKERWKNPEYSDRMKRSNSERWKDPVWAEKTRNKIKETKARKKAEKLALLNQ